MTFLLVFIRRAETTVAGSSMRALDQVHKRASKKHQLRTGLMFRWGSIFILPELSSSQFSSALVGAAQRRRGGSH